MSKDITLCERCHQTCDQCETTGLKISYDQDGKPKTLSREPAKLGPHIHPGPLPYEAIDKKNYYDILMCSRCRLEYTTRKPRGSTG